MKEDIIFILFNLLIDLIPFITILYFYHNNTLPRVGSLLKLRHKIFFSVTSKQSKLTQIQRLKYKLFTFISIISLLLLLNYTKVLFGFDTSLTKTYLLNTLKYLTALPNDYLGMYLALILLSVAVIDTAVMLINYSVNLNFIMSLDYIGNYSIKFLKKRAITYYFYKKYYLLNIGEIPKYKSLIFDIKKNS